jgi:large subunit ribosomal protein L9
MEVILIEEVPNLGHPGKQVKVKPGYARNYLLPRKLAVQASVKNVAELEHQRRIAMFRLEKLKKEAQGVAGRLNELKLVTSRKVGEQGKLYGSVTSHDVQTLLEAEGFSLDRKNFSLPEPIKALGHFEIPVRLGGGIEATVKLTVVAEQADI